MAETKISKTFSILGMAFGVASVATIVVGKPTSGIALAILALGAEYASSLHTKA